MNATAHSGCAAIIVPLLALLLQACNEPSSGAGATFPLPVYNAWWAALHGRAEFPYQAVGSESGLVLLGRRSAFFAASDWPLTPEQESALVLSFRIRPFPDHTWIPMILGAVVPVYHLNGVAPNLKFTPEALAGIFAGRITMWNDPAISNANTGVLLPRLPIHVVCRGDGSGTTYIWTSFLATQTSTWPGNNVGFRINCKPAHAVDTNGNDGMVQQIQEPYQDGLIGYAEYNYAVTRRPDIAINNVRYGLVRNVAGNYPAPNTDNIGVAGKSVPTSLTMPYGPRDSQLALLKADAADAYPVSAATWLAVPLHPDPRFKTQLTEFLRYAVSVDGQEGARLQGYEPLPDGLLDFAKGEIGRVN